VPRWSVRLDPAQRQEAKRIATELAAIASTGKVLSGSITQRQTHCGNPRCKCMADPPKLHGPYYQWTRKVRQKTVGRWLSADQRDDYQEWIDNHRRIRELLDRLEAISEEVLEQDSRFNR
jgi:hypothetical protein